jgi:Trp operon repressor
MLKNLLIKLGLISESPEEKSRRIQKLVDGDPVLQKLQSDLRAINDKATPYMNKLKDRNPELYNWLKTNIKSPD